MTEFQQTVLRLIAGSQGGRAVSADYIAGSLPGWSRPTARGVLVAHVRRTCRSLEAAGWIVFWHSRQDQWDNGCASLTEAGRKLLSI